MSEKMQARALVRGEAAGEADGERAHVEHVLQLLQRSGRFAVAGELVAQPVAGEDHQFELLALVGFPDVHVGDRVGALPEARGAVLGVQVVQLGAQVALEQVAHRLPDPRGDVHAVRDRDDLLVAQALPRVVGRDAVQLADGVAPSARGAATGPSCRTGVRRLPRRGRVPGRGLSARRRCPCGRRPRRAARPRGGSAPRRTARCRRRPACGS